MSGYCAVAAGHPWHGPYHDHEYGFPARDETVLFERLCLEIMQAGLSWLLVLKKRAALNEAFAGFVVDRVAAFREDDRARLLADARIIRNRRKIDAILHNARVVQGVRPAGFAAWLDAHHPRPLDQWVPLFRATFRFTGPEVVNEFLMSLGYLPGAHAPDCPVAAEIARLEPPWQIGGTQGVATGAGALAGTSPGLR